MYHRHVSVERVRHHGARLSSGVSVAAPSSGPQLIRIPPEIKAEPIKLLQIPKSSAGTSAFPTPQLLHVNPQPSRTVNSAIQKKSIKSILTSEIKLN